MSTSYSSTMYILAPPTVVTAGKEVIAGWSSEAATIAMTRSKKKMHQRRRNISRRTRRGQTSIVVLSKSISKMQRL